MSKHVSILAVFAVLMLVVFSSGCTDENLRFSIFGLDLGPGEPVYTKYENIRIEAEVIPAEVYEDKSTTLFFDLYNEGNTTLKDINLEMTDLGGFTSSETSKHISELKEEDAENWEWILSSGHSDLHEERNEVLRYKMDYSSTSSALYDIVAMSESEYTRLERQGTLEQEISLFYFKTKSPIEIDISLSKEQPIFEDLEFYLYVTLRDMGSGTIDEVDDLVVYYPDFLEFVESNDFNNEGDKLSLKRPLEFFDKETKKATCKFRMKSVDIRNTGQFRAEANYIYTYYKTINIKVKPK